MLSTLINKILKNLSKHFGEEITHPFSQKITNNQHFNQFLKANKLSESEQIILTVALLPYIEPYFFNEIQEQTSENKAKPNLLFYQEPTTGALLPLFQTILIIGYPETNWEYLHKAHELMEGKLFKMGILTVNSLSNNEQKNNLLIQLVQIETHYLKQIFNGETIEYSLSSEFPAKKITTSLQWKNLIIEAETQQQIDDIIDWNIHQTTIKKEWGLQKIIKPGYTALFYGASGTGKTLTATLIGQQLEMDVYRIDLSLIVSKYIGETEKNLSSLFAKAENKNWILFFDEADSLFGTRTSVSDSHDRYANQEVSYLLQRIEDFEGIIILASNLKGNIDKAFARRFQSMIEFKIPKTIERELLWRQSFSTSTVFEHDFISEIAKKYEISGGSIVNVVQYASLKAIQRNENIIKLSDVVKGLALELWKEGKTL